MTTTKILNRMTLISILWTLTNKDSATIKGIKILISRVALDFPKEIFRAPIIITANQTPIRLGLKESRQTMRCRRKLDGSKLDTENKIIIIITIILIYKLTKRLQGSVPAVSNRKVKLLAKAIIAV